MTHIEDDEELWTEVAIRLRLGEQYDQVAKAYELGEIEVWLEWQRPKTREEWREWGRHHTHDELTERYSND